MRKKKIRTYKLLKKVLDFLPDDIIYKISKYTFNYCYFPTIKKRKIKIKLPREKRLIIIKY